MHCERLAVINNTSHLFTSDRLQDSRTTGLIEGAVAPASTCNCTSCLKWLTFLMRRPK